MFLVFWIIVESLDYADIDLEHNVCLAFILFIYVFIETRNCIEKSRNKKYGNK